MIEINYLKYLVEIKILLASNSKTTSWLKSLWATFVSRRYKKFNPVAADKLSKRPLERPLASS